MINADFDPLKILEDLARNQERISINQERISEAFGQLVLSFNELNRRLCVVENHQIELELMIAELKVKDIKHDNQQ